MRSWRGSALRRKKLSAEPRKRLRKRREGPRKRRKRPREKKKRKQLPLSREKRKSAKRRERRRKPLRPRSAPLNLSEALSQAQSDVKSARLSAARSAEPSERPWAETSAPALEEASSIHCSGNKVRVYYPLNNLIISGHLYLSKKHTARCAFLLCAYSRKSFVEARDTAL